MSTHNTSDPLHLALIVGSVRDGRMAPSIVAWLTTALAERGDVQLDTIDLADHDLPLAGRTPGGASSPLSQRLHDADAFLLLVPEYNHSFPAALKNFIDWHFSEWAYKPVAFVGYGGGSGGARAVEQLRLVFPELHATTTRDAVLISAPWERLDAEHGYQPTEGERGALEAAMTELHWWATVLRDGRAGDERRTA